MVQLRRKLWAFWLTVALAVTPQASMAQTIDELFRQGNAAQSAGNYVQAEAIWRRVLREEPKNSGAYNNLGNALSDQGKLEEAIAAYRQALELNPKDAEAYYNLGNVLSDQGKLEEAIAAYRQALEVNPEYAKAYYNLGVALGEQGKLDEEIAAYRQALELNPEYAKAYGNLGVALRQQGKLEEAIAAYHQALELNPEDAHIDYSNLGVALRQQGKLEEAIAAYRQALELNPEYATAYNNLGNALSKQGKLEEAIAAYRQALELNPEYSFAYNNLGYALQKQDKLEAAIAEYEKAIQLDDNYTTARNNLAEAKRLLDLQRNPQPGVFDDSPYHLSAAQEPLWTHMRSTARIIATIAQGENQGSSIATGWVFKREKDTVWIVTNRHVLQPHNTSVPSETIEVEFFSTLPNTRRPRYRATLEKITATHDPLDLAVIKIAGINDKNNTIQPLSFHSGYIPRDQEIKVIGHPFNLADPWNVVRGTITNTNTNTNILTVDARLAAGNSGGPILHAETQEVMGIMVQIIREGDIQADPNVPSEYIPSSNAPATGGFGFGYAIDRVVEQLRRWQLVN